MIKWYFCRIQSYIYPYHNTYQYDYMIRLGISAEYSHMIIQSYDHMVFHKIKTNENRIPKLISSTNSLENYDL